MKQSYLIAGLVLMLGAGSAGLLAATSSGSSETSLPDEGGQVLAVLPSIPSSLARSVQLVSPPSAPATVVAEWSAVIDATNEALATGANALEVSVIDASGRPFERLTSSIQLTEARRLSELQINVDRDRTAVEAEASRVGATVVGFESHSLGGVVITLRANSDPIAFANSASGKLADALRPITQDNRPYLVRLVDEKGNDLLVLGWDPTQAPEGAGIGWEAPGVRSDAILGRVVTVAP